MKLGEAFHVPKMPKGKMKIGIVMREFKKKKLHSGSKKGPLVKNRRQAVAIALAEERKAEGLKSAFRK